MSLTLSEAIDQIIQLAPYKLVLSKPVSKNQSFHKIVIEEKEQYYQFSKYTAKQVFHENVPLPDLHFHLQNVLVIDFLQLNGWSNDFDISLLLSQKGAVTLKKKKLANSECVSPVSKSHNREKNYIIKEGTIIPPLVDMGIFSPSGSIVKSMYDKFKQINRFIELVDDEVGSIPEGNAFHVIDFGCGKSYLTFILYYYFKEIRHLDVHITGLDLKEDVIKKCNLAAQKYGYDGLRFELGDINGYKTTTNVDMVVTLHACDVATDFALFNAISWNAKMIYSVPCCQHEWNKQMKSDYFPILERYGIIQERFSALATDAVRANLLSVCGYQTQLLEFVDFENTPKNLLIRAVKKPMMSRAAKQTFYSEVSSLVNGFHTTPALLSLLAEAGYLEDFSN